MKLIASICFLFIFTSCIPLSIAPKIKGDKVMLAKKFKRKLPKQYALIFNDPKDANQFYDYVNTKYELNHDAVNSNVPFDLDGETFYFSYYETEKATVVINLIPIAIDLALATKEIDPILENAYGSGRENWYLSLTANDYDGNDILNPKHPKRDEVIDYLRALRIEYLSSDNYIEALLRKND